MASRKTAPRRSRQTGWWAGLADAALKAGLYGLRQLELVRYLERIGCGKYRQKGIFITRKRLARELGLDQVHDGARQDYHWDGRNTGRREHRLEALGLLTIVIGGGRRRGCGRQRWRGRANRLYPGPKLCPAVLVRKQIEADDQAEAEDQQPQLDTSPATPGQQLAEQYHRRGRPQGPDPP